MSGKGISNRMLLEPARREFRLDNRAAVERRHRCESCATIYTCETCTEWFAEVGTIHPTGMLHGFYCDTCQHGAHGYRRGCRCAECVKAMRAYWRDDEHRRNRKRRPA